MSETTIHETNPPKEFPIPEIILPEPIKQERTQSITSLLQSPPDVDCFHVLGRSGTLAATGIYDEPDVVKKFELPVMIPLEGIGNEVWLEWKNMMREEDREEEIPDEGIGEEADEESRAQFNEWVLEGSSPRIQATITRLRSIPAHMRKIAILDDMKQSGSVTIGVAPALYRAAYGTDFEYNPGDNHYMFTSSNWIDQIIQASFQDMQPDKRQMELLVELTKGSTDWPGFRQFSSDNIHSIDQLAHHVATQYLGQDARNIPPETVYNLIEKYGTNIFKLHEGLKTALRRHSQEVLTEK